MNIFLTIDIETYSGNFELDVHGYGKGLDYILELCKQDNFKATFFIEALSATRWGIEPLMKICKLIERYEQEIQLHVHPKVAKINEISNPYDILWKYDFETQKKFIETGLDILSQCGVNDISAFRAGDLAANETTLKVMEVLRLPISSNRDLDLKSSIHSRINDSFPIKNDLSQRNNIIDLPITSFMSSLPFWDGKYRHLEICALGASEMMDAVLKMVKVGYTCATILTHPMEYFYTSNNKTKYIKKNVNRFKKILKFLKEREELEIKSVSECKDINSTIKNSCEEIKLNPIYSIQRIFSQGMERIVRRI